MIVYFHVNKNKYDRDMEILEICLSLYTENRSFIFYMEREEINAFIYTANILIPIYQSPPVIYFILILSLFYLVLD